MRSSQGQLSQYKHQIYNLSIKINLLEVQIHHKQRQIDVLLQELEHRSLKIEQKDTEIIKLENECNSLSEKNKWLEDQILQLKKQKEQFDKNDVKVFNEAINQKDKQIKRLTGLVMVASLQNQKYQGIIQENIRKIKQIQSKANYNDLDLDLPKLKVQQATIIEQKLTTLLKRIQVKRQSKFNSMFTSRVFNNPSNSARDVSRSSRSNF